MTDARKNDSMIKTNTLFGSDQLWYRSKLRLGLTSKHISCSLRQYLTRI